MVSTTIATTPIAAAPERTRSKRRGDEDIPSNRRDSYEGQRRRSSILAQPFLAAICETDQGDVVDQTHVFDLVCLGGGVTAGYWADELAAQCLKETGKTAAIISAYPAPIVPYERPALTKACLNPALTGIRNPMDKEQFPATCKADLGNDHGHGMEWYESVGVKLLHGFQVIRADLDEKMIIMKRVTDSKGGITYGQTHRVVYSKLLIAAGSRPRAIGDTSLSIPGKGIQQACYNTCHLDLGIAKPMTMTSSPAVAPSSPQPPHMRQGERHHHHHSYDADDGNDADDIEDGEEGEEEGGDNSGGGGGGGGSSENKGSEELECHGGKAAGGAIGQLNGGSSSSSINGDEGDKGVNVKKKQSCKLNGGSNANNEADNNVTPTSTTTAGTTPITTTTSNSSKSMSCKSNVASANIFPARSRSLFSSSTGQSTSSESPSSSSSAAAATMVTIAGSAEDSPILLKRSNGTGYGFGSVHYIKDVGDVIKLVAAMTAVEADGPEVCNDGVIIVGGGFIAVETAAAIATHCPHLPVTMVFPGEAILAPGKGSTKGFTPAMSSLYEKQLARHGVQFARGFRARRLWGVTETGSFCTLDGPPHALKKTRPRPFGEVGPFFRKCRGVVLASVVPGGGSAGTEEEEIRVPARFVVLGLGSRPNSELFSKNLALSEDGGIRVDSTLRTSHFSGDVFAAGDVACFPLPLSAKETRIEHVRNAREMGRHCARVMLHALAQDDVRKASRVAAAAVASSAVAEDATAVTHPITQTTSLLQAQTDTITRPSSPLSSRSKTPPTKRISQTLPNGQKTIAPSAFAPTSASSVPSPLSSGDDNGSNEDSDASGSPSWTAPQETIAICSAVPTKRIECTSIMAGGANTNVCCCEMPYDPIPFYYSRFLDLSWKFWGVMDGEPVALGMADFLTTRRFAVFWMVGQFIVGAFMEGSTTSEDIMLSRIARERPRLLSAKALSKIRLNDFLMDPFRHAPKELGIGEFHADTDLESITTAFRKYEVSQGTSVHEVHTSNIGNVMAELGADWDETELQDVIRALDPSDTGFIEHDMFMEWWLN